MADMSGLWWVLIEVAIVGLLVVELVRTRRSIRRDREEAERKKAQGDLPDGTS